MQANCHSVGVAALLCPAMAATERDVRERDAVRRRRCGASVTRCARALTRRPSQAPVRPRVQPGADTVVEFRGVSKLYGPGGIGLERATFAVNRQEMVFLVGSTGSGKSTIMRLLIKELEPTEGTIRVAGRALEEIERKKVPYYRRNVGVVFQDFKLLPTRTVYDNIAYALQVTGARAQADPRDAAGHPAPDGALDEAPQLSPPALRRRAAARRRGPRVRRPPAAAARGRADRQPRPRDLDRDHAAAVPHQPRRHDRDRGLARQRDGRPDAPPRDRATSRADRPRRGLRLLWLAR